MATVSSAPWSTPGVNLSSATFQPDCSAQAVGIRCLQAPSGFLDAGLCSSLAGTLCSRPALCVPCLMLRMKADGFGPPMPSLHAHQTPAFLGARLADGPGVVRPAHSRPASPSQGTAAPKIFPQYLSEVRWRPLAVPCPSSLLTPPAILVKLKS